MSFILHIPISSIYLLLLLNFFAILKLPGDLEQSMKILNPIFLNFLNRDCILNFVMSDIQLIELQHSELEDST